MDEFVELLGVVVEDGRPWPQGFTVDPSGLDLSFYKTSPVVLDNFDLNKAPIGQASNIEIRDGVLVADLKVKRAFMEKTFGLMIRPLDRATLDRNCIQRAEVKAISSIDEI